MVNLAENSSVEFLERTVLADSSGKLTNARQAARAERTNQPAQRFLRVIGYTSDHRSSFRNRWE
jgi:hypothetical protein